MRDAVLSQVDVERLIGDRSEEGFINPRYRDYCISNIPTTVLRYLGVDVKSRPTIPDDAVGGLLDGAKKMVILIVDSLGYRYLKTLAQRESGKTLAELKENGMMIPLTSTFPSTTTTGLTSLNTGLTPQEHGMIGYTMYLKELGVVANMVSFSPAAADERGALRHMGVDPEVFLRRKTVYENLADEGIQAYSVTRSFYRDTALTRMLQGSTNIVTYMNSPDLCVIMRRLLEADTDGKKVIFAYWDMVDVTAHAYGPFSEEVSAEMRNLTYSLKTEFLDKVDPKTSRNSAFIITADHGQSDVSKDRCIVVTDHPRIWDDLSIPPTGDSRASFLYVKPGRVEHVMKYMEDNFGGKVNVLRSQEAWKDGLLGIGRANRSIRDRIGDLIVLPQDNYTFTYPYKLRHREFKLKGAHGGLSEDEMLVPFIGLRL